MKKILVSLFVLISFSVSAQSTGETNLGTWYMYFGNHRIGDRFSLHSEAQFRFYQPVSNFNQILLRTGLNYDVHINTIITLGYAYIATDPTFADTTLEDGSFIENDVKEHRVFEQFSNKSMIGTLHLEHRYRLEQRFITTSINSFTAHRARYRILLTYPISNKWFMSIYDEIFINFQDNLFDQNRLYGALGYRLKNNLNLQLGYLKNHFTGRNFDRLQFAIFWSTDFRKK